MKKWTDENIDELAKELYYMKRNELLMPWLIENSLLPKNIMEYSEDEIKYHIKSKIYFNMYSK
jgi:hypothetical protein